MPTTGNLLINGKWIAGEAGVFRAINPATGEPITQTYSKAGTQQVQAAAQAASRAFERFRHTTLEERAAFLRECASQIEALGDELLETMQAETGYPGMRCEGERGRTCGQLRMFADYIESGDYLDPRIDTALPDRQPLPRPDLRFVNQAIGVVAVFAVSNFPLAYSSAGGDTASALAAGCPVIVKGHASHPGTGELVAQALAIAATECDLPAGLISFIQADDADGGRALIEAPEVKAIGFTGSVGGGMAISKIAAQRPEPIPVFAEMGSINPVVLLPETLQQNAQAIAEGFIASLTLGTGQFCVNPGLVIGIKDSLQGFVSACRELLEQSPSGVMLNAGICQNYEKGLSRLSSHNKIERLASGMASSAASGYFSKAALFACSAQDFIADPGLLEEVFGPASLVVNCENQAEIQQVIHALNGQLTGTLHGTESELQSQQSLVQLLSLKVGRMVVNGWPTGVEVCPAMVHGGPFPASTDSRFTSVGTAAIKRFIRPVCYQNFPAVLLPDALKNENPLKLMRTVNGKKTDQALS